MINYWPLIGILLVVIGFALKFNPMLVVTVSAIVTGLIAGMAPVEVISLVVRIDREATAFSFVHLANAEARRLSELVQRLQRP